jgi:glycosyltransferase involved in cell wall biosynthesis
MGGAQTHLMDLVHGFRDRLDQMVAAGNSDSELAARQGRRDYLTDSLRDVGVPFHPIEGLVQPIDPANDCRALMRIVKLIRAAKPDLVHTHTSKAGILGRLAARITDVPAVFTAHTWSFAEGNSLKWKLVGVPSERMAARWSTRIINVSEANRSLAIEKAVAAPEKLITVHNGIGDDDARANPAIGNPVTITMVARFSAQKDHITLLRSLAGISIPYKLRLVGDGPTLPAARDEAARLGLTKHIEFCGLRKDVGNILSTSQLLVLTTNAEGFPITILEAMRAGLPVIATETGGTPESVRHEETGLLVPPRDVTAVRAALIRLLADPALRMRMGEAGRARFEREFGLTAMLGKTLDVYEATLKTASRHNGVANPQRAVGAEAIHAQRG